MDDFAQQPPYSNRGVENTARGGLRACVDWVQVTFVTFYSVQQIYSILGMHETDFSDFPGGLYGYKSHKKCGHISVLYDGAVGMGVHVQMTGQGCREYEKLGKKNWQQFIMDCLAADGKFTRMDAAIDDIRYNFEPTYFTINTLYRKVKDGCAESRFRRGKRVESFSVNDGAGLGETLYFGRENSDIQFRFYEKDFERLEAGQELEENLTAWNRTEVQCRRNRAQALAIHILNGEDLGSVIAGILKNYLNFLVRDPNESNKARWKVSKWWTAFLGDVEPLKLTMVAPDKTIEKSKQWVTKQVAPTLGMLFMAEGSDFVKGLLEAGMDRLSDEQVMMAQEYIQMMQEKEKERESERNQVYQLFMSRTVNTHLDEKKATDVAVGGQFRSTSILVGEQVKALVKLSTIVSFSQCLSNATSRKVEVK